MFAGCNTYKHLNLKLESSSPTVSEFSEMNFRQIEAGKSILNVLGETEEVFNFESGKSFYLAYELPEFAGAAHIQIRSHFSSVAGTYADIVYPTIVLLDKDYTVTRKIVEKFQYVPNRTGIRPMTSFFPIEIKRTPEEKYMIIFTDPKYLGELGEWHYSGVIAIPDAAIFMRVGSDKQIEFVAGGMIKVRMKK